MNEVAAFWVTVLIFGLIALSRDQPSAAGGAPFLWSNKFHYRMWQGV